MIRKGIDCVGVTVVFACHDGEGNYLLGKRSTNCRDEHHRWDPGGGAVELGSTILATLAEEIRQEYCTVVQEAEFLGNREVFRTLNGVQTHWITFDYRVLVDRNKVAIGEPHKMEAIGWFRLDKLPSALHSQYPHFLKKYRAQLV